jgi:hypothetical protein
MPIFFADYWNSKPNVETTQRNLTLPHKCFHLFPLLKCSEILRQWAFIYLFIFTISIFLVGLCCGLAKGPGKAQFFLFK